MGPPRAARLTHPLLRLEVLRPDGTRTSSHRVYCTHEGRSVSVERCCACVYSESVAAEPFPSVACDVPRDPEELGHEDEVGAVVAEGAVALVDEEGTILRVTDEGGAPLSGAVLLPESMRVARALEILAAAGLESAVVVDAGGLPLGVFRAGERLARMRGA